jgi:hypothetical protein
MGKLNFKTPSKVNKSQVALKAFFGIADKWHLNAEQERVLLGTKLSTLYRWKSNNDISLSVDTIERISYILGIYKALRILLPNEQTANAWLHKANEAPLFAGKSAMDKLLKGHVVDLADVRRYLDSMRG